MPERGLTRTRSTSVGFARFAITTTFLAHALLFASWTPHIPDVKAKLDLSEAALGTALLGAPAGSVIASIAAGWLLPRLGSGLVVRITLVGYTLTGITVGLAPSAVTLFGALLLWGGFQGSLDVAMNTQGVAVERRLGRPIMSGLHGAWSVGAAVGAGLGTLGVSVGLSLPEQLAFESVLIVAVVGTLSLRLLPDRHEPRKRTGTRLGVLRGPVLALGLVAFAAMVAEGAAADWSALYLREVTDASVTYAGLGYAAFSIAMLSVRLTGNRLLRLLPPRTLLPLLSGIATLGMLAALLIETRVVALLGFAALGIGLAMIVPVAFSSAGRLGGDNAGPSITAVAVIGWAGFMCGPPIIGYLADLLTLSGALLVLPALTFVIALVVRRNSAFAGGVTTE